MLWWIQREVGDEKEMVVTPHLTSPIPSHSISSHPGWGVPGLAAGLEMRRRSVRVCVRARVCGGKGGELTKQWRLCERVPP